jgi:small-conductance mechanosensitive channel
MRGNNRLKQLIIPALIWLAVPVSACGTQSATPTITPTATPTAVPTATTVLAAADEPARAGVKDVPIDAGGVAEAVAERTPVPTPTPNLVDREINEFTESVGLAGKTFLGLAVEDWIDLVISVLIFAVGYWVATRLLRYLFRRVIRRTARAFYEIFIKSIDSQLQWLVGLFFLRLAVMRLGFIDVRLRTALDDIFFIASLGLLTLIVLKLIDCVIDWYRENLEPKKNQEKLDPVILLIRHGSSILVIITAVVIGLAHFGITSNVLNALLIIIVIGLLLIARDTISDVLNGFVILIDEPFRVGDAIRIEGWDEWGWVMEIGARTTRIRTRDNQLVIVPNASLVAGQVVNYTYPDPAIRMHTDFRLDYGSDLSQIRRVIEDTMRGTDEVLPDKPVQIRFRQFGESTRLIRVHWWISTCDKQFYMADRVNAALEAALAEAGFNISFTKYQVDLTTDGKNTGQATHNGPGSGRNELSPG